MKRRAEDNLGRLVASMKKWNRPGCPQFFYPEDVRREFDSTLTSGRWWEWLPCWASPLEEFALEVAAVAAVCRVGREDLARRILEVSSPPHESPVYAWFEPYGPPVPLWEVGQAVTCWIFYDLRPALRAIIELELDCRVD